MSEPNGLNAAFIKLYRKLRQSGMKHQQAFDETKRRLAEPKEKNERRKEKPTKRRR